MWCLFPFVINSVSTDKKNNKWMEQDEEKQSDTNFSLFGWREAQKKNNGRLETARVLVSARVPSGRRAALLIPLSPMYSTRPCCLVEAITRHPCLDPDLSSWYSLAHQAHIALSEAMSNIEQQGSSLDSFPTYLSP